MFRVKAINVAGYSQSSPSSDAVVVQAAICEYPPSPHTYTHKNTHTHYNSLPLLPLLAALNLFCLPSILPAIFENVFIHKMIVEDVYF